MFENKFNVFFTLPSQFGVVDVEPEAVCHGADSVLPGIAALDF